MTNVLVKSAEQIYAEDIADVLIDNHGFSLKDLESDDWRRDVLDNLDLAFHMCDQGTYDEVEGYFIDRVEERLKIEPLHLCYTPGCCQRPMEDNAYCSDCRTIEEKAGMMPQRLDHRQIEMLDTWLLSPVGTIGDRWRR